MSFDRKALADAVQAHGAVTRILIVKVKGSAPRGVGTSMLVWKDGQSGTIGGGTFEFRLTEMARQMKPGDSRVKHVPLGPELGQCCGGHVSLVLETFGQETLPKVQDDLFSRQISPLGNPREVKSGNSKPDFSDVTSKIGFHDGILTEEIRPPGDPVWIYGAGHVGAAIVAVLAPLPQFDITWIDTSQGRFPPNGEQGATVFVANNPADAVKFAPPDARHLVMTYSHAFDLEICHRILQQEFASAGLIGSSTKWARFRKRLGEMGHDNARISRIRCPIGLPELGKHPQAIAVGVAATLLSRTGQRESRKDRAI